MKKPLLLAAALSSSVLFALALPNEVFAYGMPALGTLALIPLYFAMGAAPSYRFAALAAGLYGALHHALSSYWLYFFKDFALYTIGATTLAYFVVYAVFGFYLAFFLKKTGPYRPLAFALLWTSFEFLKSTGFLGYPWGLLPYTQTEVLPLLQIADITGIYGLSFLLAFANAVLAEGLARASRPVPGQPRPDGLYLAARRIPASRRTAKPARGRRVGAASLPGPEALDRGLKLRYFGFALFLGVAVLAYGRFRLAEPFEAATNVDAVLVQQNVDPWYLGEEAALEANIRMARSKLDPEGRAPDIVVFSETSLKRPYKEFTSWFSKTPASDPLVPFIRDSRAHLFTGAPVVLDWETLEMSNSVLLIDPAGRQVEEYAKLHPVPFAEAIPLWEFEWFRTFMRTVVGMDSGWVMGSEYTVFELPTKKGSVRFGAPICFEDAFPEVCREFFLADPPADFLLNLTNDSWSKTNSAEIQHFAAARFRAIEFRRTLVRSTNGGLTCVVDPSGAVIAELPLFEQAALRTEIPIHRGPATAYLLLGDWFARLCLLLSASWSLILIAKDFRARRRP
ncbi:MAG: apolipoprotein N-acyltransferase [Spirochaetaceae bacterium]|nr:apolipoprotein N-acyltransferase [Spirochaetaceae bacterium]